jgi:hypothetical protein
METAVAQVLALQDRDYVTGYLIVARTMTIGSDGHTEEGYGYIPSEGLDTAAQVGLLHIAQQAAQRKVQQRLA